ncbi:MAG: hypothetical protein ACR2H5_12270 [Ktedonobacteraceae bacterium]
MNIASQYLLTLAKRNAQAYASLPNIKAIMLTGSAAEGISDFYSDIDMILYCQEPNLLKGDGLPKVQLD